MPSIAMYLWWMLAKWNGVFMYLGSEATANDWQQGHNWAGSQKQRVFLNENAWNFDAFLKVTWKL